MPKSAYFTEKLRVFLCSFARFSEWDASLRGAEFLGGFRLVSPGVAPQCGDPTRLWRRVRADRPSDRGPVPYQRVQDSRLPGGPAGATRTSRRHRREGARRASCIRLIDTFPGFGPRPCRGLAEVGFPARSAPVFTRKRFDLISCLKGFKETLILGYRKDLKRFRIGSCSALPSILGPPAKTGW